MFKIESIGDGFISIMAHPAHEQDAAATEHTLEVLGPFLDRHPPGDFRHGRQQRQLA